MNISDRKWKKEDQKFGPPIYLNKKRTPQQDRLYEDTWALAEDLCSSPEPIFRKLVWKVIKWFTFLVFGTLIAAIFNYFLFRHLIS